MTRFRLTKAMLLCPLVLVLGAAGADAAPNWFHDPATGVTKGIGSAVNPTPRDLVVITQGPAYPTLSRMYKEQGMVALHLRLTEEGAVRDARIERSSGFPRLDDAAIRYMKDHWRYKPHGKGEMPAVVQAEVTFKLD